MTLHVDVTGLTREAGRVRRVGATIAGTVNRRELGVRIPFSGPFVSDVVRISGHVEADLVS